LIVCPLLWIINSMGIDTVNSSFSSAQVYLPLEPEEPEAKEFYPEQKEEISDLQLEAQSAISVWFNDKSEERVLFEKDSSQQMPMASLTKLMTALVVSEIYPFNDETENLLNIMLIESDNEAAYSLADYISEKKFVELMNIKAEGINLSDTHFANSSGIDNPKQYSTSADLVQLANYILKQHPEIFKITIKESYQGKPNTNELLEEIPGIIGGKTGETPRAQECLLLIVKAPNEKGYLINVILSSENRFDEMRTLINWLSESYVW